MEKENKKSMLEQLMDEAREEVVKECRGKYLREIKDKMRTLKQAEQLVRNCQRDIEDLELRIKDELE